MSEGRVVHCKKEKFDVYIGRPSKYGNMYSDRKGTKAKFIASSRQEAIDLFEEELRRLQDVYPDYLHEMLEPLKGKVLGCWCSPLPCHGDVIIKLIKEFNI